jgi:hypothetical protein
MEHNNTTHQQTSNNKTPLQEDPADLENGGGEPVPSLKTEYIYTTFSWDEGNILI